MTLLRLAVWGCLAGAVLLLPAGPVLADAYDEIERRLKTTGVDAALAREITGAIRRGAAWARSKQTADGGFALTPGRRETEGPAALLALGLAHTGARIDREAASRALARLRRAPSRRVKRRSYEGALYALLLHALAPEDEELEDLYRRFARGRVAGTGYWDYQALGGEGTPNLSTSQFAALALQAGERAGVERDQAAWDDHLASLLESQTPDGSFPYYPRRHAAAASGYPTGTYMGMASVALGRDPTKDHGAGAESARARANRGAYERARRDGLFALERHVRWTLAAAMRTGWSHFYYTLYALEKACIFLDLDHLGDVDWYAEGARRLLALQRADGAWYEGESLPGGPGGTRPVHQGAAVSTGFALLFLLRASEVYSPVTPRHLGPGGGAVTGPDRAPRLPDEDADAVPPVAAPPLEVARALLARATAHPVRDDAASLHGLRRDLLALGRVLAGYREAAGSGDHAKAAFMREAEAWLLTLASPLQGGRITHDAWRVALGHDALRALAGGRPEAAEPLARLLSRVMADEAGARRHVRVGWFGAGLDALGALGAGDDAWRDWIIDHALVPDEDRAVHVVPAILALERMRPATMDARREVVHRILRALHPLIRSAKSTPIRKAMATDVALLAHRWGLLEAPEAALVDPVGPLLALYADTR